MGTKEITKENPNNVYSHCFLNEKLGSFRSKSLQTSNSHAEEWKKRNANGGYSSALPDIFQLSNNSVQSHGLIMNSSKKEETKAFDFISV